MRKHFYSLILTFVTLHFACAQKAMSDSLQHIRDSTLRVKDSSFRAMFRDDSLKVEKDFAERAKWESIEAKATYPLLKGGKYSGVISVNAPTEMPDPNMDYKILFELTNNNPDSTIKEVNGGLDEIARILNLHVAGGIPSKRLKPVIIVHGAGLNALKNNEAYQKKYKVDNPNIALIHDLEKLGARFIACGQAMAFFEVKKEELLPEIKISFSAQTVITSYQLKSYVWRPLW